MKLATLALSTIAATVGMAETARAASAAYTLNMSAQAGCEIRWSNDPANTSGNSIADTLTFADTDGDAFLTASDTISQDLSDGPEGANPYFKCTGPNGAEMTITSANGGLQHNTVSDAEGFTLLIPYVFAWTFSNAGPTSDNSGTFDSDAQAANIGSVELTKSGGGLVGSLTGTVTLDTVTEAPLVAGQYQDTMTITVDTL